MDSVKRFCGSCGSSLAPYDRFCGVCGAPGNEGRSHPSWASKIDPRTDTCVTLAWLMGGWRRAEGCRPPALEGAECGLLLASRNGLAEEGVDADAAISVFIAARWSRARVAWHLLDTSEDLGIHPRLDACVHLVAQHRDLLGSHGSNAPVPLLLFGNDRILPMGSVADAANVANEGDVDTDMPYVLLKTSDLWHGILSTFEPRMSVGRLPVGATFGGSDLARYLSNCEEMERGQPSSMVSGLSAKCWQGASRLVHGQLTGSGKDGRLLLSPETSSTNISECIDLESHWFYFNVHGSDADKDWFGQEGSLYPRACSPHFFRLLKAWNIIGVEACYGARFVGLDIPESAMLSALSGRTVAFVGASRIAYGPPDPPNALADLVVRDFLSQAMEGSSLGEAMNRGRDTVVHGGFPDADLSSKTALEFNLFGDPTVRVAAQGYPKSMSKSVVARPGRTGRGFQKIDLAPSGGTLLQQVRRWTEFNGARISESVSTLLAERHPEFLSVTPSVSRLTMEHPAGGGPDALVRLHYVSRERSGFQRELLGYCDVGGRLRHVLESK